MQGICAPATGQVVVLKSRFIGLLFPLEKEDDVAAILSEAKRRYPEAKHYVYAYRYDGHSRSRDDGEPSGSAGRPLLTWLDHEGLTRTLVIVVRYFGGSKLGASRLLRTYLEAAKAAFAEAVLGTYEPYIRLRVRLSYDDFALLEQRAQSSSTLALSDFVYNELAEVTVVTDRDTWARWTKEDSRRDPGLCLETGMRLMRPEQRNLL